MSHVSIITPCYNASRYIRKLLDSVLGQNYHPIEFIVVNDGSTDDSLDILESYRDKFQERGIDFKIISKKNGGVASAINYGIKIFTGEYVTFIDADDYLRKDSIKKRVEFLEKNKDFDAVYSATNVVESDDYKKVVATLRDRRNPHRTNLFKDMLLENDYIWTPVVYFVRSSFFLTVHPDRHITEFSVGQNIQLFLPLWYRGRVGYIDDELVTIVAHEDSHSRINRGDREIERQREIQATYRDTLKRIDMPKEEYAVYESLLEEKYRHINERVFYDVLDGSDDLARLYARDQQRFRASHFKDAQSANQDQLASRMVFSSHSLEKSLSNDGFEIGHGFMVVRMLIGFLDIYTIHQYDKKHLAYINTLSVLRAFYERHLDTEYINEIEDIFGQWLPVIRHNKSQIGGAEEIFLDDKKDNNKKNFKELAEGRFAVRSYTDKPVSREDIREVIKLATKTPTVCNRQPVRVRVMYNKDIIARVLEVQGGIAHYDTPPVLLLITADDNSYVGINERNQGYIDGGLFAMSILYALEYKKLAACPLHAMFEAERDFKIRGMLNIPDNEKLITFISVGHFEEVNSVCKSFRYPTDSILTETDRIYPYRIEQVITPQPRLDEPKSNIDKIRIKLRLRSRIKNVLRHVRSTVRIRTRIKNLKYTIGTYLDAKKYRYKKAEGAIFTLTGYFNYGNVIQRYALQQYLRQHGHDFVSYVDPFSAKRDMYRVSRIVKMKTPLRAVKRFLKSQKPYWYIPAYGELYAEASGWENIIDFVNKNVWIKPFDPKDDYKKYIVGSDQVWRDWWGKPEILGHYFFSGLTGKKAKKIAYAASFGNDKVDDVMSREDIEYVRPYVKLIDNISVREKSGVRIIKDTWGIQGVQTVVDPTLLLEASDYSALIDISNVRDEKIQPIFTYILEETPEIEAFVRKIQERLHQNITDIRAHADLRVDVLLPPVEFWLKGFRDAELVVTNSFHGMMFSIINQTDFIVIGREVGGLSRIKDFLSEYGIEGRFVSESDMASFDISTLQEINWKKVDKKLRRSIKESGDWLLNAVRAR